MGNVRCCTAVRRATQGAPRPSSWVQSARVRSASLCSSRRGPHLPHGVATVARLDAHSRTVQRRGRVWAALGRVLGQIRPRRTWRYGACHAELACCRRRAGRRAACLRRSPGWLQTRSHVPATCSKKTRGVHHKVICVRPHLPLALAQPLVWIWQVVTCRPQRCCCPPADSTLTASHACRCRSDILWSEPSEASQDVCGKHPGGLRDTARVEQAELAAELCRANGPFQAWLQACQAGGGRHLGRGLGGAQGQRPPALSRQVQRVQLVVQLAVHLASAPGSSQAPATGSTPAQQTCSSAQELKTSNHTTVLAEQRQYLSSLLCAGWLRLCHRWGRYLGGSVVWFTKHRKMIGAEDSTLSPLPARSVTPPNSTARPWWTAMPKLARLLGARPAFFSLSHCTINTTSWPAWGQLWGRPGRCMTITCRTPVHSMLHCAEKPPGDVLAVCHVAGGTCILQTGPARLAWLRRHWLAARSTLRAQTWKVVRSSAHRSSCTVSRSLLSWGSTLTVCPPYRNSRSPCTASWQPPRALGRAWALPPAACQLSGLQVEHPGVVVIPARRVEMPQRCYRPLGLSLLCSHKDDQFVMRCRCCQACMPDATGCLQEKLRSSL